jgi:hypothetical protein
MCDVIYEQSLKLYDVTIFIILADCHFAEFTTTLPTIDVDFMNDNDNNNNNNNNNNDDDKNITTTR